MSQSSVLQLLERETKKGRYCSVKYITNKLDGIGRGTVSVNMAKLKEQDLIEVAVILDIHENKNGKLMVRRVTGYKVNNKNKWYND